jgi:hypothetical protein
MKPHTKIEKYWNFLPIHLDFKWRLFISSQHFQNILTHLGAAKAPGQVKTNIGSAKLLVLVSVAEIYILANICRNIGFDDIGIVHIDSTAFLLSNIN